MKKRRKNARKRTKRDGKKRNVGRNTKNYDMTNTEKRFIYILRFAY